MPSKTTATRKPSKTTATAPAAPEPIDDEAHGHKSAEAADTTSNGENPNGSTPPPLRQRPRLRSFITDIGGDQDQNIVFPGATPELAIERVRESFEAGLKSTAEDGSRAVARHIQALDDIVIWEQQSAGAGSADRVVAVCRPVMDPEPHLEVTRYDLPPTDTDTGTDRATSLNTARDKPMQVQGNLIHPARPGEFRVYQVCRSGISATVHQGHGLDLNAVVAEETRYLRFSDGETSQAYDAAIFSDGRLCAILHSLEDGRGSFNVQIVEPTD